MYGTKPAFALVDQHAVNCIIDTVRTNPGQVTIAAIVPCPPGCADALFRLVAQNGQRLVRLAEQVGDFQQFSGLRVQVQHLAVHRMIAARHPVALQHHAHRARAGPQHLKYRHAISRPSSCASLRYSRNLASALSPSCSTWARIVAFTASSPAKTG